MPEITRERVIYRGGDDDSDDDRSTFSRRESSGGYRTVQRYRVTPSRVEPVEDERRTSRTTLEVGRRGDRLEIDRSSDRFVVPERPRSAIDIRPRSTIVERYVEREPIREPERERTRTVVYERDRREPERPWERESSRPWETDRDVRETDVRVEKRVTEERREQPYELERYQRETEYYERPEPAPAPIVIRQRAPEPQQIIVQEAPAPPPIYLPQPAREEAFQVVRRETKEVERPEPRRAEDEYYYRRDVKEVGGRRRSHEDLAIGAAAVAAPLAIAAYNRREREIRPRDSVSDEEGSEGSDYVVKRRIIKKERSRSRSPHHKRHLAEGALAGAGAAALISNHRDKQGNGPQHRGRQVVGGAALGALGAEVLTRARSRYRESHDEERSRSRSSSRHSHRKIKTALGLAAAGLAAAAAAKYVSNRKANNDEQGRGRSRTRSVSRRRYSDDDDDYDDDRPRSRSKHADPKHRASQMAKAGVATAAVAGVVEHFRNKSRKRDGSRSKSRIRTGAEIAASGLAGAAVAGLYENRKAKGDRELDAAAEENMRRERRRSRSRARSVGAYSDPGVDPELGMVQYGTEPVYTAPNYYDPAVAAGAGAAYGATREHRSKSGRRRYSSESSPEREQKKRSRSRSRVRDIAGAAAGTAAAAIGINQYRKRKEKKEAERERERRRYEEEESSAGNYYDHNYHDEDYSPSPPHASGGSYYPENNQFPPPPTGGFTQQPLNTQVPPANAAPIPTYNPADYVGQQPPNHDPYGYPPGTGDNVSVNERSRPSPVVNVPASAAAATMSGAVPYFPPPPTAPLEDEHVPHDHDHNRDPLERAEEARVNDIYTPPSTATPSPNSSPPPHNKSVNFAPLSPTSSRRLAKIHEHSPHSHAPYDSSDPTNLPPSERLNYNRKFSSPDADDDEETDHVYDTPSSPEHHRRRRRRRNSDPSSDRPNQPSKHRRRHHNASRSPSPTSSDEIEVLPDRFDRDGRPLDRYGKPYSNTKSVTSVGTGAGGQEMVERFARDFGDVIEGRKSWKDMLRSFVEEAGAAASPGGSDSGRRRR